MFTFTSPELETADIPEYQICPKARLGTITVTSVTPAGRRVDSINATAQATIVPVEPLWPLKKGHNINKVTASAAVTRDSPISNVAEKAQWGAVTEAIAKHVTVNCVTCPRLKSCQEEGVIEDLLGFSDLVIQETLNYAENSAAQKPNLLTRVGVRMGLAGIVGYDD